MRAADAVAATLAHPGVRTRDPAIRPLVVLVVDDEQSVRRVERQVLEQAGYTVVEAATADEALEAARDDRRPIDVLVTDLTLPGLQGPDLAGRLLALLPTLGVVFTSGYDQASSPAGRFPGSMFLQKPFTVEALATAVAAVSSG
jgi:two-component system cell cycle sensor histidine kinase/response regulator CckA